MRTPTIYIWDNLNAWVWGKSELTMPSLRTAMQGKWAICVEESDGDMDVEPGGVIEIRGPCVQGCMPHLEGDCDGG